MSEAAELENNLVQSKCVTEKLLYLDVLVCIYKKKRIKILYLRKHYPTKRLLVMNVNVQSSKSYLRPIYNESIQ